VSGENLPPSLTASTVTLRVMRPDYVSLHVETEGRTIDAASNADGTFVYDSDHPKVYARTASPSDAMTLLKRIFQPGVGDSRGITAMLAFCAGASLMHQAVSFSVGRAVMMNGEKVTPLLGRSIAFKSPDFPKMKIYLGASDHLMRRIEFSTKKPAISYVETCSNLRINPRLSTEDFAFAPPPHAREKTDYSLVAQSWPNGTASPTPANGILDISYHPASPVLHEIAGTVLLPDGMPASRAKVFWITQREERPNEVTASTVADEAGRFAFPNAEALSRDARFCQLYAEAKGHGSNFTGALQEDSDQIRIALHSATELRLPFVDEAGKPVPRLAVRLLSLFGRNQAVSLRKRDDAYSSFAYPMDGALGRAYRTDPNGILTIPDLPQGFAFRLSIEDSRFADMNESDISLSSAAVTNASPITVRPGARITGRVTYLDHRPAAGIHVAAQSAGDRYYRQAGDHVYHDWGEAVTNVRGEYEITRLNPGLHNVGLALNESPGNLEEKWTAPTREQVSLTAGGREGGIDFTLEKGATISGRVTTASGVPVKGAFIGCTGPARPKSGDWTQGASTKADGSYFLRVPPGQQRVYVGPIVPGYQPMQDQERAFTVRNGESKRLDFTLKRE
jgi:hypothetical protein